MAEDQRTKKKQPPILNPKMRRQLLMYNNICHTEYHGPEDLMRRFKISFRTLQRDLRDFRDAGILHLKHDKKRNNYILHDKDPVFNETVTGRRRQHLIRLHRLCTLIDRLERTDMDAFDRFITDLDDYLWYREVMVEEPDKFPPEECPDRPVMPQLEDIKASYYSLFPDSNERQRQRDFKALREIGYEIYYDHQYRIIIFDNYDDDDFWA